MSTGEKENLSTTNRNSSGPKAAPKRPLPEDKLELLIKEVHERPVLWNTSDPDYGHKRKTSEGWTEVQDLLGVPEDVLKVKWKNIRDMFRRECKKKKVAEGDVYNGSWKYFNSLAFLYNRYPNTDQECPLQDNEIFTDPEILLNVTEGNDGTYANGEHENHIFQANINYDTNDSEGSEAKLRRYSGPSLRKSTNIMPMPHTSYTDEEYDAMFLQSLTPYFRYLDPARKLQLRSKILNVLMEEMSSANHKINIEYKNPHCYADRETTIEDDGFNDVISGLEESLEKRLKEEIS